MVSTRFSLRVALAVLGAAFSSAPAAAQRPPAPSAEATPEPEPAAKPATEAKPEPKTAAKPETEAQPPAPPQASLPALPRLHHAPVSVTPAHKPFTAKAEIEHPELVKRALLVYRTARRSNVREVEFRRGVPTSYVAEVLKEDVVPTHLEYAIELESLDGTRTPVFGTREQMHRVHVPDDLDDARERALDARLGGRRSVFFGSAEYVNFGTSRVTVTNEDGSVNAINLRDNYYRLEGGFTYRPLRLVAEFSLRAGIVRGRSPVPVTEELAPGQDPAERFDVGLNYGSPMVRLRFHDLVHMEAELLTSVTEVGFSAGTGGGLLFGDPYGSKLSIGFETIKTFGTRFFSRMDIVASRHVQVAPIIEVTNMPHAEEYGVRLLGEIDIAALGGFSFALRGGYQARVFTAGGPGAGLTLRYAF